MLGQLQRDDVARDRQLRDGQEARSPAARYNRLELGFDFDDAPDLELYLESSFPSDEQIAGQLG